MASPSICPKCGTARTDDMVEGFCPGCLAQVAIAGLGGNEAPRDARPARENGDTEQFGAYELIEEIAHGGMGVVFKAWQVALNRIVALKMIRADRLAREEDILRFRGEAESAAKLQHPGIVAIHDVGEVDGQQYYSMDYVAGQSLAQMVREHPLPPLKAAQYVREIARAIHYAHSCGIIHRDLKPSNVLVDLNDEPRVTDFGLAKVMQADTGLTMSGTVMGSPNYMSPEQARGRNHDVDFRSDVYALGAILYELISGRPPFQADSTVETLRQVCEVEPVSPRLLNPNLPRDLETISLKCLDKTPSRRYASAGELADELSRFVEGEPIRARPISRAERAWRWCRRKPAIASMAAAILVILVTGLSAVIVEWRRAEFGERQSRERLLRLYRSNGIQLMEKGDLLGALPSLVEALRLEHPDPASENIARIRIGGLLRQAPKLREMWFHNNFVVWAAFTPDGTRVLTASKDGQARIWSVHSGEPVTPVLEYDEAIVSAAFDRTGGRVVITYVDQTAQVWDANTGAAIGPRLRHNRIGREEWIHAAFSPDGRRVVTGAGDKTIRIWAADAGWEEIQVPVGGKVSYLEFHPTENRFVAACSDGAVWLLSGDEGKPLREPWGHKHEALQAKFSPDGRYIVTVGGDNMSRVWDSETGSMIGRPLPHAASGIELINALQNTATFSPDSELLATTGSDRTTRLWNFKTGRPVSHPLQHTHSVMQVSFSPDSRFIITTSHDHSARIWDVASGEMILALPHNGFVRFSGFSPNGHHILTAGQDNVAKLWDIAASRTLLPPMEDDRKAIKSLAFSPDGALIATTTGNHTVIWKAETGTQHTVLPHAGEVRVVAFSPDSRLVVTGSSDRSAVVWETLTGKRLWTRQHSRTVYAACFSTDGGRLLTGTTDGTLQVWETATGQDVLSVKAHNARVYWAAFSPDGKKFVTCSTDKTAQVRNAANGELICSMSHDIEVRHAVFSPDSSKVLTSCADPTDPIYYPPRSGQLWDATTGKPLGPPLRHSDGVLFGAFSPDGKYVATASEDGTARIWEVASGKAVTQPLKHDFHVHRVEFTRDGRLLLTAGGDGTVRLWDTLTGEPAMPLLRLSGVKTFAALSPDGRRFATGTDRGQARIWDLIKEVRSLRELTLLGEVLTGNEFEPLTGPTPLETSKLQSRWIEFRSQRSNDSSKLEVLAWHSLQADYCRFQRRWSSALFHLERLLAEEPTNPLWQAWRADAQAALAQGETTK